jgi:putative MATE family efflux protein
MHRNLRTRLLHRHKPISKTVIGLALPVILSNLSRVLMNLADVAMVGRLGAVALAATGMGSMLVWVLLSFAISLRTATQTVASRRLGQKKFTECGTALHNGYLLAAIYGIPVSVGGFLFADRLVPLFISDPAIIRLCVEYTSLAFLSVLFSTIGFVFQGFFTGIERTRIHMKVTITANALNVYLNAGLIYGREGVRAGLETSGLGDFSWLAHLWNWFPFPQLGVKGAALATVIASGWLMIHYGLYLWAPVIRRRFGVFGFKVDTVMLKRQISLAWPQGSQEMIVMVGFALFYKIAGMIGVVELAATEVVFTILQASFMPAAGIGQACATLVGKHLGEKNHRSAETSIVESVRWALWIMGSLGILFMAIPQLILPLFTDDPEVISIGTTGLRLAGLVQFADAVGMTLWFALSGAGNTRFPAAVETGIVWFLFLPAIYLTGVVWGLGFIGPWFSLGAYLLLFAMAMVWKILQGDWKKIEV